VVSDRVATDGLNDKTFTTVAGALEEALGAKLFRVGEEKRRLPLGGATERRWAVSGTYGEARMVLVPICADTGSLVFVQVYRDHAGKDLLDRWMKSFRFTSGRDAPACGRLDPK
jgi:hypothetical protein